MYVCCYTQFSAIRTEVMPFWSRVIDYLGIHKITLLGARPICRRYERCIGQLRSIRGYVVIFQRNQNMITIGLMFSDFGVLA